MSSRTPHAVAHPPERSAYDADFYSWSLDQARLIRARQWARVDIENIAEEIESLGREQFNKLESALRVLMLHMLKWDHQPASRSRSWALSIETQRLELGDVIADNPGLKPRIPEAMARGYRKARLEAAKASGDLPTDANVDDLARFIQVVYYGLSIEAQSGASRKDLHRSVDLALRAWPHIAPKRSRPVLKGTRDRRRGPKSTG